MAVPLAQRREPRLHPEYPVELQEVAGMVGRLQALQIQERWRVERVAGQITQIPVDPPV